MIKLTLFFKNGRQKVIWCMSTYALESALYLAVNFDNNLIKYETEGII